MAYNGRNDVPSASLRQVPGITSPVCVFIIKRALGGVYTEHEENALESCAEALGSLRSFQLFLAAVILVFLVLYKR